MFYKWLLEQLTCLESSSAVQSWLNSVRQRMETVGIVYLSNVGLTSVRPPFENSGLRITDGDIKAELFSQSIFSLRKLKQLNLTTHCHES